jgi:hypothetical protein
VTGASAGSDSGIAAAAHEDAVSAARVDDAQAVPYALDPRVLARDGLVEQDDAARRLADLARFAHPR